MLLYTMLYIVLAYLMLFAALTNSVCLNNASFFFLFKYFLCQGYELSGEIALKNNHYYYYYAMLTVHRAHLLSWRTFNKKCTYIIVPECVYPHIHFCFKIIEERIIFHCIREVIDQKCFTDI